jgi:hypothetical protein
VRDVAVTGILIALGAACLATSIAFAFDYRQPARTGVDWFLKSRFGRELGHDTGPTEVLRTTALLRFCFTIIFLLFGVVLIVAAVVR